MRRFAKWFARTAFGMGVAIGLTLNLGLYEPVVRAASCPSHSTDDCSNPPPGLDQDTLNVLSMACQVQQAIFNDGTDPGVAFALSGAATASGTYGAQDYLGRGVSFQAVWADQLNLKTDAPDLYGRGWQATSMVGILAGPAGKIKVQAIAMQTPGTTLDTGWVLMVTKILAEADFDTFSMDARMLAGPRVIDTTTGKSTLLSDQSGVQQAWVFTSDLATIYAAGATPGGIDDVNWDCVNRKKAVWDLCTAGARRTAEINIALALLGLAACLWLCSGFALVGPWAWVISAVCAARCLVGFILAQVGITANLLNSLKSCDDAYRLGLQECGVVNVQT